ncbi:NAD-dependent oxidoreductase [Streptococcus gallolyticus]|uniref:NAD-dependent oxidoreductase n=2 Tax=Streptococcus gallolyticus TaxID=315405 RepID=A0A139QMK5_9STRE|nr:NAD-dependent oxidoreductase [Streptococcus gallolyticus]
MTSNAKEAQHLKELAQSKGLFLFEAITTRYFKTYQKIREWLPKIGQIKLVESKYSQYSRRYDAFQKGEILPVFDPAKAGGAMMDLNLYNLHFVMGLFGQPDNQHYFANVERGIDTSGVAVLNYPDFIAVCTAAKDSKGKSGSLIRGTKGYIETTLSPNLVGEVKLVLNDGSKESFDDGLSQARLIPEFQAFVKMINDNDLEACYKELEASLSVSKVQTQLRKEASIIFPMDN